VARPRGSAERLEVGEEGVPQLLLGEDLWVAQHDQAVPRAREGDVEAARVGEEADALRLVRADAREDDEVLLAPLEGVYRGDLHLRVQLLRQGAYARGAPEVVRGVRPRECSPGAGLPLRCIVETM